MVKEYFIEEKNKETEETRRQKLGPAYFEDSPEFKKEVAATVRTMRQAILDITVEAYSDNPEVSESARRQAREKAEILVMLAEHELGTAEHDSTLALAAVEAGIGLANFQESAQERRIEEAGEDFVKEVEERQELRGKKKDLERASAFLISMHPNLTKLYARADIIDWLRLYAENLARGIKRLKEGQKQTGESSNVAVGNMANIEASVNRYLAGQPISTDYQTILKEIEGEKEEERKRLGARVLRSAETGMSQENYKNILRIEMVLDQFYQMERLLEEEQRLGKRPQS